MDEGLPGADQRVRAMTHVLCANMHTKMIWRAGRRATSCGAFKGAPMSTIRTILACGLLIAVLLPHRVYAAIELEPGTWQDTETGMENGKPAKVEVTTDCMTAEDAKDPVKSLAKMQAEGAGQCEKLEVKPNGNVVTLNMKCGDAKQGMLMEMSGTFTFIDRKHYTTSMKSTIAMGGQTMTSDKQVDSKWVAAECKKK